MNSIDSLGNILEVIEERRSANYPTQVFIIGDRSIEPSIIDETASNVASAIAGENGRVVDDIDKFSSEDDVAIFDIRSLRSEPAKMLDSYYIAAVLSTEPRNLVAYCYCDDVSNNEMKAADLIIKFQSGGVMAYSVEVDPEEYRTVLNRLDCPDEIIPASCGVSQ